MFYFKGLEFTSVTKKVGWRWPHEGVIIDRDGSLTGIEYASVLPYTGLIDKSVCPVSYLSVVSHYFVTTKHTNRRTVTFTLHARPIDFRR